MRKFGIAVSNPRVFALLTVMHLALMAQVRTAELNLRVVDARGDLLPCRVLVRSGGAECATPTDAVDLRIGPDRWFMSPGRIKLDVPVGEVLVRVERGLEFIRYKKTLSVTEQGLAMTIPLKRWINLRRRGYLTGENHVHLPAARVGPMLVAEGLDFGASMSWWNGPRDDVPVPRGVGASREIEYAGRSLTITVHDAELEHRWGAAYIQNLSAPLSLPSDRQRPNLDYLRAAVETGAIVHYQAGWSREVALDALLGFVHTVNVCNNNFHMHRFQPRRRYSNLLEVEGFPVYANTDVDMLRMNTETYYRLLNCGLRLAAGAGSAIGVKEVPVGYNRAYVRAAEDASIEQFNRAWAAGRNFVTNGPMLFLRTMAGRRPGDVVAVDGTKRRVQVQVTALSDQPLTAVELVANGQVVHSFEIVDTAAVTGSVALDIAESTWIAARCTARDELLTDAELAAYASGDAQQPSRLRFAHTSPLYVEVRGEPVVVRRSVEETQRVLQRFEAFARETAAPKYLPGLLESVTQARVVLDRRLELAARNGARRAPTPLTLSWEHDILVIHGEHLPGKKVEILYIEAYCRPNSHTTDWGKHTVIGHTTRVLSMSPDRRRLELECRLNDGATVRHIITAHEDEVDFRLTAHNPTQEVSEAHWAQPCIRVGDFTGLGDPHRRRSYEYLAKSFVFLDGELSLMPTKDWATEARYVPGQVWAAPGVAGADVNPRPLNPNTPSNGLIGCFGARDQLIMATAWEPYQELFQGVITCLHSDFRIGGLQPGETKQIHGKIYFVANDVPALLERYARDFPQQAQHANGASGGK